MGTLAGWSKRQKLTIDHTQVDDELTDFPVKVIIPSDNPLFYTAKSDGSDVRFTAADGETLLKFEREVHNTEECIAVYHVKIPSVSDTDDTDFYLYYGNADASDASTPNDVWDSNYELVLHMGPSLEDSTSNGNDGTNYGTTLGLASDGYYRSFDGSNDYIVVDDIIINSEMTYEVYVNPGASPQNAFLIDHRESDIGVQPLYIKNTGVIQFYDSDSGDKLETSSNVLDFDDNPHHIVAVGKDSTNAKELFYDGSSVGNDTEGFANYTAKDVTIGYRHSHTSGPFDGNIYEVRISSIARSDAWIKATSASLHNALLTFGDEETVVRPRVQVVFI